MTSPDTGVQSVDNRTRKLGLMIARITLTEPKPALAGAVVHEIHETVPSRSMVKPDVAAREQYGTKAVGKTPNPYRGVCVCNSITPIGVNGSFIIARPTAYLVE